MGERLTRSQATQGERFMPRLVIFDKDGTLIDFQAMWSSWLDELGRRLDAVAGTSLAPRVFRAVGYEPATGRIDPLGVLALAPLAEFRAHVVATLLQAGVADPEPLLDAAWLVPDPVATARPLADLAALFGALRAAGMQVAVATSDNRGLTEATLRGLGVNDFVDALVCADDGLPIKPSPEIIRAICARLDLVPAQAAMVGDSLHDVEMGRAAGAGLVVGVLSGISARHLLEPYADLVLPSIADLLPALGLGNPAEDADAPPDAQG